MQIINWINMTWWNNIKNKYQLLMNCHMLLNVNLKIHPHVGLTLLII